MVFSWSDIGIKNYEFFIQIISGKRAKKVAKISKNLEKGQFAEKTSEAPDEFSGRQPARYD